MSTPQRFDIETGPETLAADRIDAGNGANCLLLHGAGTSHRALAGVAASARRPGRGQHRHRFFRPRRKLGAHAQLAGQAPAPKPRRRWPTWMALVPAP
ncbi:hypothetical protein ACU4GD_25345 [Cupriavidus basilensis]